MNQNEIKPKFSSLIVLLNECIVQLQKDMLRIKCARDSKSIRQWNAVLNCAAACKKIIHSMENNEFEAIDANIRICRIACNRCVLHCYTSVLFSNSYKAAHRLLLQLSLYTGKSGK